MSAPAAPSPAAQQLAAEISAEFARVLEQQTARALQLGVAGGLAEAAEHVQKLSESVAYYGGSQALLIAAQQLARLAADALAKGSAS